MPEPASTAVVAAAAGGVFPTTLLLMFFVSPPMHVPKGETKAVLETKSVWTLQSTTQIQTQNPYMCGKIAKDMMDEIEPVQTLTVRAYCLCPAGNGTNLCFNEEQIRALLAKKLRPRPTVQPIGPNTELHEPNGSNAPPTQ
jgi:hypothetical protein